LETCSSFSKSGERVLNNIDETPPSVKMRQRLVIAGEDAECEGLLAVALLLRAIPDCCRKIPPRNARGYFLMTT